MLGRGHELLELALPGGAVAGRVALELGDVGLERGRQERGRRRRGRASPVGRLGVEVLEPVARAGRRRARRRRPSRRRAGATTPCTSCVKPGSVRSSRCGSRRRARRCARARSTLQPARASSAAQVSELTPEPTKTASKRRPRRGTYQPPASRVYDQTHAAARGRVRPPGHHRRGGAPARSARRSAGPGGRTDARQRHEAARRGARGARRPGRSRRAPHDRALGRRRVARDRRDGHLQRARPLARGRRRAADPGRGRSARSPTVQVQNRGTVGGNVCVNDPTNHLPPLLAALGATFTILGRRRRAHVSAGRLLPRRLHDRRRRGRAAHAHHACPLRDARQRATRWRASRSACTAPTS